MPSGERGGTEPFAEAELPPRQLRLQLRAYLPAFMRIAVDVDVKIASLEGFVLRLAQLRTGRNSELVVGFFLQRYYNGTVLARRRLMNMCGRGLDACGSD